MLGFLGELHCTHPVPAWCAIKVLITSSGFQEKKASRYEPSQGCYINMYVCIYGSDSNRYAFKNVAGHWHFLQIVPPVFPKINNQTFCHSFYSHDRHVKNCMTFIYRFSQMSFNEVWLLQTSCYFIFAFNWLELCPLGHCSHCPQTVSLCHRHHEETFYSPSQHFPRHSKTPSRTLFHKVWLLVFLVWWIFA